MNDFNNSAYMDLPFGAEAAYVQPAAMDGKKPTKGLVQRVFNHITDVSGPRPLEKNPCAPRVRTRPVDPDDAMARLWEYGC